MRTRRSLEGWTRGACLTVLVLASACSPSQRNGQPGADNPADRGVGAGAPDPGSITAREQRSPGNRDEGATEAMTPPAAEPRMQAVLDRLAALGGKPIEELSPAEARKQPTPADAVKAVLEAEGKPTTPEPVASVKNQTVPGAGGPIQIRVYTPSGTGPFPVLVYWHGGGWVIADLDTYDASPRALANQTGAVVVSAHYRQGPEHKFPAAHEDAFAVYRWVRANTRDLNGDSSRIAVSGESAGGNMAAAVSMMARDSGVGLPVHQLLVYPVANADTTLESYQVNANAKPLNEDGMQWFAKHYFRTPADGKHPFIALTDARLEGLPPATIITAEIDPLRSGDDLLAERFRDADVEVELRNFDGVTHEFFGMGAVLPQARDAQAFATERLKEAFERE